MSPCWYVLLLTTLLVFQSSPIVGQDGSVCQMNKTTNSYPPSGSNITVPWYVINLDLSPAQRWKQIAADFKAPMIDMITSVVNMSSPIVQSILAKLDQHMDEYFARLPGDTGDEIKAFAQLTGLDVGVMFIYQVMYEVMGMCTSVVAQNTDGSIVHARNLDFGLFMGWDKKNNTWSLTEKLRPIIFNARWLKGGKVLFESTQYAGYIGLHTGAKAGAFSITVDSRFDSNLDKYLLEWLFNKYNASFLTLRTREVMEQYQTYNDALNALSTSEMVGPSYIIIGGIQPGEGAVLTYSPGVVGPINTWTLQSELNSGSFYVLETNYDHWNPPPFFDDRRDPAEDCMNHTITASGVNFSNVFWMLSSVPNLNDLTTFTTLIDVKNGRYEAYKQRCWDSKVCSLW